jgi:hypothetical protein
MSIILQGSTSGSVTLQEPAVAGTTVLDLPATSGTVLTSASSVARSQLPVGSVLQVVSQTFKGTLFSTTSNSMVATGFGVSITRASSTSNILVSISTSLSYGGSGLGIAIYRGTTSVWNPSASDGSGFYGAIFNSHGIVAIEYLDTPPAGSSFTYNLYTASRSSTTSYVNLTNSVNNAGTTITLMEIAA